MILVQYGVATPGMSATQFQFTVAVWMIEISTAQ